MGSGVRNRIAQAAQLSRRVRLLAALGTFVLLGLTGCGADLADATARAKDRLDQGGAIIQHDIATCLAACEGALSELPSVLAERPAPSDTTWHDLEELRSRHGITGLLWEGPDNVRAWAGRPIDPPDLPAPPRPWHRSFQHAPVTYHAGPFVRALVVGPVKIGNGHATATWLLEEVGPAAAAQAPFQERWLEPLNLLDVALRPPEAPDDAACDASCHRRVAVSMPDGSVAMVVDLRVHGLHALEEQIDAEHAHLVGLFLLLLLGVATVLVVRTLRRRLPRPTWRWLGLGAWVIFLRGAVKLLDVPGRFPALREAFSPTEFAVETLLGWLASPGDFALSALTYLLVVICITYAFRHVKIPTSASGRLLTLGLALLTSGVSIALWLLIVETAVAGGHTPFFQAHTFIPSAPPALMLLGLVATTATTYLVAHIVLRRGLRALPPWRPALRRAALLLLSLAVTGCAIALLATPHPVAYALVATAALVAGRGEGRFAMALPGRVLVLSVLAVAFAYPVLWARVGERERDALADTLDDLLGSEDSARAGVAAALADARTDPHVAAALSEARLGGRPEGIALHLWLQHAGHWQRSPSVVTVLDDKGRTLEKFSLTTLPRELVPVARPPVGAEDEQVIVARGSAAGRLRCVVGRLRLRDSAGAVLGHVVFTVPHRLDLRLRGLSVLATSFEKSRPRPLTAGRRPQFAALLEGVVTASSDPSLSRAPGSFGPPALDHLSAENPQLAWDVDGEQGFARYSPTRRGVFAVRRVAASLGSALLALARLVVVGVGLGLAASIACLVFTLGSFRLLLHHKILLSYFVMSVVPLVLLGLASARETQQRHDGRLTERLQTDLARVRSELELMGSGVFDSADSDQLEDWAPQRRHDTLLYRDGVLEAASRTGLIDAELLSVRLPPSAYRATVLERRQLVRREAVYAGRAVWFGYAPILDGAGRTRATVAVPLLYDADRIEEQLTLTGSVLLAAYMLTLVLVLVGGIYAARRLTRPLGDLAVATERVAAGDLDVALKRTGGDEIGQLVVAFNTMIGELRDMTARVAQAERESAWRRMASQVAHEIKNPLTPMRLMLQQMEADLARDPARAAESIRHMAPKVLAQIEGLDRIARDFAQFARLPRQRKEAVDIGLLVRDVTELYAGAEVEGVKVRCDVANDLPTIWWDEQELRRVLLNLVLNAMEALEGRGGGRVTLRARAEAHSASAGVMVTIRDDGVGIEPEDAQRLFEPQFSTKTRGTGLGLAIVHRIVQDLGGRIDFQSTPGEGTTFRLWLPSAPPPPAG